MRPLNLPCQAKSPRSSNGTRNRNAHRIVLSAKQSSLCPHMHAHTFACTHACTHAHTHTHMHTRARAGVGNSKSFASLVDMNFTFLGVSRSSSFRVLRSAAAPGEDGSRDLASVCSRTLEDCFQELRGQPPSVSDEQITFRHH